MWDKINKNETMAKFGRFDSNVEIDIEEVLDEVNMEDLEEYLAERRGARVERYAKATIIELCLNRMRRNMEGDKEEVRSAINELIDELF